MNAEIGSVTAGYHLEGVQRLKYLTLRHKDPTPPLMYPPSDPLSIRPDDHHLRSFRLPLKTSAQVLRNSTILRCPASYCHRLL